jgi:TctA family transporter
VLGSIVEQNFFRTLELSEVGYLIFLGFRESEGATVFDSPLAVFLVLLTLFSLLLPWIKAAFSDRLSGLTG